MEELRETLIKGFEPEFVVTLEALPGNERGLKILNTVIVSRLSKTKKQTFDILEFDGADGKRVLYLRYGRRL
jgi:hypothetical protein